MDNWNGYPVARQRLIDLFASARHTNPVVITGDIHSNWVADLQQNFDDPSSATVGTELIGTSIASGGDGHDNPSPALALNPHLKFFNSRRGYVRVTLTPEGLTADYRVVPFVSKAGAPVETRASFVVERGQPGAKPA